MANIALCTEFPTDANVLAIETTLESPAGGSHTVTVINDDNVGTQDFSSFDLIMTVVPDVARAAANGATYRAEIDGGKPAVLHMSDGSQGAASGLTLTVTEMDLTGTILMESGHDTINIVDASHAITDEFGTGNLTVWDATSTASGAEADNIVGDVLADGTGVGSLVGLPVLAAVEQGTLDLVGTPVGARVVLFGFMRQGSSQENANHDAMLAAMVDWAVSTPGGGPGKGNSGGGRGRGNRGGGGGNGRGRGANKFAWNRYRFLGR